MTKSPRLILSGPRRGGGQQHPAHGRRLKIPHGLFLLGCGRDSARSQAQDRREPLHLHGSRTQCGGRAAESFREQAAVRVFPRSPFSLRLAAAVIFSKSSHTFSSSSQKEMVLDNICGLLWAAPVGPLRPWAFTRRRDAEGIGRDTRS